MKNLPASFLSPILAISLAVAVGAQTLPTGVTMVPFYDTTQAGLSFKVDKQTVSGMYEIPGKPQHFLVLGYFGFVWSLYPDTAKAYAPNAIKDYKKKQLADFNNLVRKGFEQGATAGAFDPDFARNRSFYIIYHKYENPSQYKRGLAPSGTGDGKTFSGLIAVERWKLSEDYASLAKDTTIFLEDHGNGYGGANLVFGKDGYMYITCSSYSKSGWDLSTTMRKILRIDVSRPEAGKMYSIPPTNPFATNPDPKIRKEIFAYGFRNTYLIAADYLTGSIWGAEVGQTEWEEVNVIKAGVNHGWANGGDGESNRNGAGVEGPCSPNTSDGIGFTNVPRDPPDPKAFGYMTPYAYTGPESGGRKMTCEDITNATWSFHHRGISPKPGMQTAVPGLEMNCIVLGPAFRGDPSSPFYGYHFVSDVERMYLVALKEGVAGGVKVGGAPAEWKLNAQQPHHNGITSFGEDSFGNLYVTLLSSDRTGAFEWHDIYRLSHPALKPLAVPRNQVTPTTRIGSLAGGFGKTNGFHKLIQNGAGRGRVTLPRGYSGVEIYSLGGALLWTSPSVPTGRHNVAPASLTLPEGLAKGVLGAHFVP